MPKTAPLKFLFNAFLAYHRYDKRGASAMIIIDLEWNSGSDYSGFDEILQIGAVRIKTLGGCILDTFNIYVKPQVNTTLHPAAVKLPELWHSFADGVCFPVAFLKFREWARHEKDYAAWEQALQSYAGRSEFHYYPELNHLFVAGTTKEEGLYGYLKPAAVDETLLDDLAAFVLSCAS